MSGSASARRWGFLRADSPGDLGRRPRPSSTLPTRAFRNVRYLVAIGAKRTLRKTLVDGKRSCPGSVMEPGANRRRKSLGHALRHKASARRTTQPVVVGLARQAACFSGLLTRQHWSEFCPWPQGPMPVPRPGPPPGPQPCASATSGVTATRAAARMIADLRCI